MIEKHLKSWLVISLILYVYTIVGQFDAPIEDTGLFLIFQRTYLWMFILSFVLSGFWTLWNLLLPVLNRQYILCLGLLLTFGILWTMFFKSSQFHLYNGLILLAALMIPLIKFHYLNHHFLTNKQNQTEKPDEGSS